MAKIPSQRVKKTVSSKRFTNYYQSFYDLTGHRRDFRPMSGWQTRSRGSDDSHYHRCPSPSFLVFDLFKNSAVIAATNLFKMIVNTATSSLSRGNSRRYLLMTVVGTEELSAGDSDSSRSSLFESRDFFCPTVWLDRRKWLVENWPWLRQQFNNLIVR